MSLPVTVLLRDEHAPYVPRAERGVEVRRSVRAWRRSPANLVIMCAAHHLDQVAPVVHDAASRHRLRALLVHAPVGRELLIPLLERAGIRALRNLLVHTGGDVPRRVVNAWKWGAQDQLVAHAEALEDRLLVVTCALELIEVPVASIRSLAELDPSKLPHFSLAEDGAFLEWLDEDIQLDLDAIRVAVDPTAQAKAATARLLNDRKLGAAIATVRKAHQLRQSDIPGVSSRQMRRIEQGDRPRSETLRHLAEAHGLAVNEYLNEVAEAMSAMPPSPDLSRSSERQPPRSSPGVTRRRRRTTS